MKKMGSKKKSVLMIATSRRTRGGITAVLKAYETCPFWKDYQIRWLQTHADGSLFYKFLWAFKAYMSAFILIPQYDIIHIHLSQVPSLIRKTLLFVYAKLLGKKTIVHVHSTMADSPANFLYRFVFKRADYVIALSQSMKKAIEQEIKVDKNIVVVYNPCKEVSVKSVNKEKIILFAGVLTHKKGYHDLIRAFASIAHRFPEWKLVLAGSGGIEQGMKMAQELEIENQVSFPGWISGMEKESLFSKASVFCLPSYTEGFPTAILEACSYGIPFITTPVGGIPEIITDGKNGLLFTPGDINQLKEKLALLLSDSELRQTLGEEASQLAKNLFSLDKISSQIANLYKSLS